MNTTLDEIKDKIISTDTLFNNIKTLCEENRINISKLERDLGFSEGLISKWKVSIPSVEKVTMIALYFKVSLDYILGLSSVKPRPDDMINNGEFLKILRLTMNLPLKKQVIIIQIAKSVLALANSKSK